MNWKPKTEDELYEDQLCPNGMHPFTVLEGGSAMSKSGKSMIRLKLNIHTEQGDFHVYDYISPDWMEHKFKHFFYAVGLVDVYEAGALGETPLYERQGWCEIGRQKSKDGFPPKSVVTDYIVQNKEASKPAGNEDDVPF